jgi:hypothetical protein
LLLDQALRPHEDFLKLGQEDLFVGGREDIEQGEDVSLLNVCNSLIWKQTLPILCNT